MESENVILFVFVVIFAVILPSVVFFSIFSQSSVDCDQKIQQCSYVFFSAATKTTQTQYVLCNDSRATKIEFICITEASKIAQIDFYNKKVQP